MEHAPTITHDQQDAVLAAFLEPGTIPELAKRVNMSLAALATWTSKHAQLIEGVHAILMARCKLIKAQLELSALSALATVSSAPTQTDDAKLRERSLERQRKAACAILRHKSTASGGTGSPADATTPSRSTSVPPAATHSSSLSSAPETARTALSTNAQRRMANAASPQPKPSLAERLAQRRLATLAT